MAIAFRSKLVGNSNGKDVFSFATHGERTFNTHDDFISAVATADSDEQIVPATELAEIDEEMNVGKSGFRLTKRAFHDLLGFSDINPTVAEHLARNSPNHGMKALNEMISTSFHRRDYRFVTDTRNRTIDAVVSRTYQRVSHMQAIEPIISYDREAKVVRGTITGRSITAEIVSEAKKSEVAVNDVVAFGVYLRNSTDGSSSIEVGGYNYRLRCLNGMRAKSQERNFSINHIGQSIDDKYIDALASIFSDTDRYSGRMGQASNFFLTDGGIMRMRNDISESYGTRVESNFVRSSINASRNLGDRPMSAWDFVNAATELQHAAPNQKSREVYMRVGDHILDNYPKYALPAK